MHSMLRFRFGFDHALLLAGVFRYSSAQCPASNISGSSLSWHPPNKTAINDLSTVINGTGVSGFIFNSSLTPTGIPYSTYNWCNMPHVRGLEYPRAAKGYKLEYVEVIHRHHKRTPYAANTFPHESYSWNCNDESLFFYGAPLPDVTSAQIAWEVYTSSDNPFAPEGFNGTCQFPQISGAGLLDSRQHGKDLYDVYHGLLNFLPPMLDNSKVVYRVTNNVITSQVAGQLIEGMYTAATNRPVQVLIQPNSIDSLEPTYTCDAADTLYSSYGVGSSNANWTAHLNDSATLFNKLNSVSGVNGSDPDWSSSYDHYFDNLSSRLCHQKPLPCSRTDPTRCITEADAEAVFRRGEYEYSFIYRDSFQSLAASTASYGVWVAELSSNLRAVMQGQSDVIYRHNVAHDGSVSRLLSILQIDVMVWPGMGAEVVFELYSNAGCSFVRILFGGQIMRSSNPSLGYMDMLPLQTLLAYFEGLVGVHARKISDLCSS